MIKIAIAVVVTFIVTALWNLIATKKIRINHQFIASSLIKEMEEMATKMGHEDLHDYFMKNKGQQYADTAMTNIKSFIDSFSDRGAD